MCAWPDRLPAIVQPELALELILFSMRLDQLVESRSGLRQQLTNRLIAAGLDRNRSPPSRSQRIALDLLELHDSPPPKARDEQSPCQDIRSPKLGRFGARAPLASSHAGTGAGASCAERGTPPWTSAKACASPRSNRASPGHACKARLLQPSTASQHRGTMRHISEDRATADPFTLERPACAACGDPAEVRVRRWIDAVYFCAACRERAEPPDPDDELGEGD